MNYLVGLVIAILFLLSFIGLIYPILPSVLFIWAGVLLYHFVISSTSLTFLTWGTLAVFTLLLFITDQLAGLYFVKRSGGSANGMRASTLGVILGCFIFPPFGIIIVPFFLVLITELLQQKPLNESLKVAFGTFLAFLSGTFAKGLIQLAIIVVFLFDAIYL